MIEQDVTVIQIIPDLDPSNNLVGYNVALAYKAPMNPKAWGAPDISRTFFKHLIHVIIPKEEWHDQYKMGTDYHAIVNDVGEVSCKKLT